ncbi:hypothetical protein OS493_008043 [Desmophyllum pertusum]|uniref:CxC3 like cysteine cluster domain-containing protein n=1 Tax=Desmophyllum pertusum TaxID=174260 RepID=A0A9W9YF12_9CNID|nr:hypothetical protein OS493_008043 [Desmophyllum pertusum]
MASVFTTIYDSLSFGNVLLLLLLLLMLHYLMVLYEFRNMPPGPRLTAFPVLGNAFSLDFKAEKLTDAFQSNGLRTSKRKYRSRSSKTSNLAQSAACSSLEEPSFDVSLSGEENVEFPEENHSDSAKGRFDFNNYAVVCNCCGHKINPWSLENIIAAGYWPGSPKDLSYLFDQNLFRQWDFLQKRLPGTSEVSFVKALGDLSESKGRAPTITANTFNRSFKEWKFCTYEVQITQGLSWMECPTCSLYQHSCHVDGNMKLYRYECSGTQKRSCYYGSAFISQKADVDCHIKNVYAKAPRSKNVKDSMCGESHWKAAQNTARRRAKLDETGLEIAGCRHGLAQWAVNMYQGEIYGYAHFLQSQRMFPAGVEFFWEDIVCKYWKWAAKVGGSEMTMKPALSVMHAKAHKWSCQVLWGGRWQEGSACTTGEEVEQINAHMSRCGNTTKYMLPEGRDELITEHALAWNKRKICAMVTSLVKRFERAVQMCDSSKKECDTILEEYNFEHKDVDILHWKKEIIKHANEDELISNSRRSISNTDNLKHQMEMLSFSIARTTTFINKQSDSSKQRTRLRKKIASERTQLNTLIDKYNVLIASDGGIPLTIDSVLTGDTPNDIDQSDEIPIRVKKIRIPTLQEEVIKLEDKLKSQVELEQPTTTTSDSLIVNNIQVDTAEQTVKYSCSKNDPAVINGKVALLKKGLFFCREQVQKAMIGFQEILHGNIVNITEILADGDESNNSGDENVDSDDSGDDGGADESSISADNYDNIVLMRPFNTNSMVWIWEFPYNISQSTYQGRNGSNACSIIALLIAEGIHQVNCDLDPSHAILPTPWVTLVCGCIKEGNALYDRSRASLPQRYLSAAEAAMVAGDRLDASIDQPLPVRVSDPHPPSTLRYQLLELCSNQCISCALFIVNGKTALFVGFGKEKLLLVDSHLHEQNGAMVILGKLCNVDNFVHAVQESLGVDNDTFGHFVQVTFQE